MNKERLLKLADYLENNVDISKWRYYTVFHKDGVNDLEDFKPDDICGSVCCALGNIHNYDTDITLVIRPGMIWTGGALIKYQKKCQTAFDFAMQYFDLCDEDVEKVFCDIWQVKDEAKITPQVVAASIRFLVKNNFAKPIVNFVEAFDILKMDRLD